MIRLTTVYNPGDVDPGRHYTHLRVRAATLDFQKNRVRVSCVYFYVKDERWRIGGAGGYEIAIDGDDFATVRKVRSKKDGGIVQGFLHAIEEYLLEKEVVKGTLEDDPEEFETPPPKKPRVALEDQPLEPDVPADPAEVAADKARQEASQQ